MFRGMRLGVLSCAHNNYLSLCETCTAVKNMIPMTILEIRIKFPSNQIKVQAKFKFQILIRHV